MQRSAIYCFFFLFVYLSRDLWLNLLSSLDTNVEICAKLSKNIWYIRFHCKKGLNFDLDSCRHLIFKSNLWVKTYYIKVFLFCWVVSSGSECLKSDRVRSVGPQTDQKFGNFDLDSCRHLKISMKFEIINFQKRFRVIFWKIDDFINPFWLNLTFTHHNIW